MTENTGVDVIYERPEWQKQEKFCDRCGASIYFVKTQAVYPPNHKKAGKRKWIVISADSNRKHNLECPGSTNGVRNG